SANAPSSSALVKRSRSWASRRLATVSPSSIWCSCRTTRLTRWVMPCCLPHCPLEQYIVAHRPDLGAVHGRISVLVGLYRQELAVEAVYAREPQREVRPEAMLSQARLIDQAENDR